MNNTVSGISWNVLANEEGGCVMHWATPDFYFSISESAGTGRALSEGITRGQEVQVISHPKIEELHCLGCMLVSSEITLLPDHSREMSVFSNLEI